MAGKTSERADLIVVGSEPAAAVAALRGCALGLSVALVWNDPPKRPDAGVAWLAPPGIDLCKQCGIAAGDLEMTEFVGLSLHSVDLRRRLDWSPAQVERLLSPRHASRLAQFDAAAEALGIVIDVTTSQGPRRQARSPARAAAE